MLKELGVPDHLTCLLRNLYEVKKKQLEPFMEQMTVLKLGKEYNSDKAVYDPLSLTYIRSMSCEM